MIDNEENKLFARIVVELKRNIFGFTRFEGRTSRLHYNSFLVFFLIGTAVNIFISKLFFEEISPESWELLFAFIFTLAMLPSLLAIMVRRLHDANFSGLWMLLCLIPGLNFVVFWFILLLFNPLRPGSFGANKYGEIEG